MGCEIGRQSAKKTLASQLRHRVSIQSRTDVSDGEGGQEVSWSTDSTVYAAIYPTSASQVWEYRTVNVEATHVVKLRGYVTISEENRILFGSRVFEVLTVENYQERDFTQVVTCKEKRD